MSNDDKKKPGRDPERVKIDGEWVDAIDTALAKKRPKSGWPKGDGTKAETDEDGDGEKDETTSEDEPS